MTTQQHPPRTFGGGKYHEVEFLGKGGFGRVFLVEDENGLRWVLKQLHAELLKSDPNILGRLEREAKIQANLRHSHIAVLHDWSAKEGYLVVEHIEGSETLRRYIDRCASEGMDFDLALTITKFLEEALTYVHDVGQYVHLDVTPGNILIQQTHTRRGKRELYVVLIDFGLARIIDKNGWAEVSSLVGTPGFWPPEQRGELKDQAGQRIQPGERSDVYALAVVIGVMLTGRSGKEILEILRKTDHPLSLMIPPEVKFVLKRATEEEPEKRYVSVQALVATFTRAVEAYKERIQRVGGAEETWPIGSRGGASRGSLLRSPFGRTTQSFPKTSGLLATILQQKIVAAGAKMVLLVLVTGVLLVLVGVLVWNLPATHSKPLGGLPDLNSYCQSLHYETLTNAGPDFSCYSSIRMADACDWENGERNLTPRAGDPQNSNSMSCYEPAGTMAKQSLDLSTYCRARYLGGAAVDPENTASGWQCQRKMDLTSACQFQYSRIDAQARYNGNTWDCYGLF